MISEQEIRALYNKEMPLFSLLGELVSDKIIEVLVTRLGSLEEVHKLIKIPIVPRLKDIDSLISKALYRDKNYSDPYSDITDKVGVRFVVLLSKDVKVISEIIETIDIWDYSQDRNYEGERLLDPKVFDYQSVHYILTLKKDTTFKGETLPAGLPCEVQIRTLLQHAYSELTHDTVYKPKFRTEPIIVRHVAKSMALIETTDEIFDRVYIELVKTYKVMSDFFDVLKTIYSKIQECKLEEKMNFLIIDKFYSTIPSIKTEDLVTFIDAHSFLPELIKEKSKHTLLYRQPIVILLYYLANTQKHALKRSWPLTETELAPFFTDLGISYDVD
jgi:putative GTP pyrophosphokinase